MKITKSSRPHGYFSTKIYFPSTELARKYVNNKKKEFVINKARKLEHLNLSKKKRKQIRYSKNTEYLLTKQNNKFLLWEKIK